MTTYLQDILNARPAGISTYSYRVLSEGRIVFNQSMTGNTVQLTGQMVDPGMTVESMPERFQLAAVYWVLHRFYSKTDANKSSYYHEMYQKQWEKTRHNRLRSGYVNLGGDI